MTTFLELTTPVLIASDHGGYQLKEVVKNHFSELSFNDLGPASDDSVNYPDFAHALCTELSKHPVDLTADPLSMGLLICGSGQGMAMTANKYKNVRAALCWNTESAQLARSHNNAQILCLGSRLTEQQNAVEIIQTFFSTKFAGGRHTHRIELI